MLNPNCGIYIILAPSGKYYVGSALSFTTRWRQHRSDLKQGKHHCPALQRAYDKYGLASLRFCRLMLAAPADLIAREQYLIDRSPKHLLYNRNITAGSRLGMRHTDATKAKISASKTGKAGRPLRPEDHARLKAAREAKGAYTLTEAHKANIRAALDARALRTSVSGVQGVTKCNQYWVAHVRIDGHRKYVGRFKTVEAAAAALVEFKQENP